MIHSNYTDKKVYDNKCVYHIESKIISICSDCILPACLECMFSDAHHRGHKADQINLENTTKIFEKFKNQQYPNLSKCMAGDKELEELSNMLFNKVDEKHIQHLEMVTNEFNQLRKIIDTVENDIIRQLITIYDENKDVHDRIESLVKDNSENVNLIMEKHKEDIENYDIGQIFNSNSNNDKTRQHIEILKHSHKSQLFIRDNEKAIKNKPLQEYNETVIKSSMDSIKDSIKDSFVISKWPFIYQEPKRVLIDNDDYFIYKNSDKIPYGTVNLALGQFSHLKVDSIPNSVKRVFLLDGFNQELTQGLLPNSIYTLCIGIIKQPLIRGSIPSSVSRLYLLDGFDQDLTINGMVKGQIDQYFVGNTTFRVNEVEDKYDNAIYKSKNHKYTYNRRVKDWEISNNIKIIFK